MLKGFVTAIRTLTILPCPGRDANSFRSALPWFPLVGLILGLLAITPALLATHVATWLWPEATAALTLILGVMLTRGLHLDGLADCVDGFGGGRRNREKILAIMKDPHAGAFGQLALILTLLLQWVILKQLIVLGALPWILYAFVLSRTVQVYLAVRFPYARAEGGTAAPFIRDATHRDFITALFVCSGLLLFAGNAITPMFFTLAAILLAAEAMGRWCQKRIGGITGDILGAGSVLAENAVLLAGTAIAPILSKGI